MRALLDGAPGSGTDGGNGCCAGFADMTREAAFVPPMLARLVSVNPAGPGWVYERKLDGLRCIAVRAGQAAELWSRSRQSFTARFGGIARALAGLSVADIVLDGEIVALEGGRTSFALLQRP